MNATTRRWSALCVTGLLAHGATTAVAQSQLVDAGLEEIVVTGSRIRQRLEDAPIAVTIFNREDIDRASQDSIGKVLQQLPANTGSPPNTNVNNGGDGSTRIDLRGLGPSRSLVLLNGRRFVYGGVGGDTSADMNMIPSSMLERVEVLGVGASTVYGADAIGGVANFITRAEFDGAEFGYNYALSDKGDGEISGAHFVAGRTFGRGYFTLGAELVDQKSVFQGDRRYSQNTEYLRADGTIGYAGSPATPQGLFAVPRGNALGLAPGRYTRVTGSGEPTTAEDFRPFVPSEDLFNFAPDNYLQTPSRREYLWLAGGFDLNSEMSVFVEGLLHSRDSRQRLAASTIRSSSGPIVSNGQPGIPADNYYNPFGVDLQLVTRRLEEQGGRRFSQAADMQRYVAGLRGALGPSWNWELSATYGRNDTEVTTEGDFRVDNVSLALGPSGPDAGGRIVCGQRDPTTGIVPAANVIAGCVPLNLFGGQGADGSGTITREQLDFVTNTMTDEGYNEQQIYELVFRGDWGAIQSRPVHWAVGTTYRVESAGIDLDPAKIAGSTGGGQVTSLVDGGDFTAGEIYAETVLPLLSGLPAVDVLNLTAGLRFSDFSTFGSVTTYQGGLLYRPQSQLTLRAGYGRVFRAPPIVNLFESNLTSSTEIDDPCGRDPTPAQQSNCAAQGVPGGSYVQDEFDSRPVEVGGNRDLQPEEGDSISAGATYTPSFVEGLSLSVDYWRTSLDDVITTNPDIQLILNSCVDFNAPDACSRIRRYPDGTIEHIDATHVNAARLASEGFDVDIGYGRPLGPGTLDGRAMATYLASYEVSPFAGTGTADVAGTRYYFNALPHWRGLGYLAYSVGPWSGSYQAQYIGSFDECKDPSAVLIQGAFEGCRSVDDQWYHDVQLSYRFAAGLALTLSIENLADADPPRVNYSSAANTDTATYRLLGRTYFASIRYTIE